MQFREVISDPAEEHVFVPDMLFDLVPEYQHITLPTGFVRELGQTETLTDLFDTAAAWVKHLLSVDRASIAIHIGGPSLQVWSVRGTVAAKLDKSLPLDHGRMGRAIAGKTLILSRHLSLCPERDSEMLYKAGLTRAVNAPLIFRDRCFGAINAAVESFEDLGLREAVTLQCIANWMVPAVAALTSAEGAHIDVQHERAQAEKARSESAMKSSFIANVSHEIRTPLNAILGTAQALVREDLPPNHLDKMDMVMRSSRALLSILNDILDLSKIDTGRMTLRTLRHRPALKFGQTVDLWRDRAAQKGLDLDLTFAVDVPGVLVFDEARVQQVLSNLLSNAIKFTDRGSVRVHVSTMPLESAVQVTLDVIDTGHGIAEEDLKPIFEPFEQGRAALQAHIEGSGLGLSICRRMARLMGGDVSVQSTQGEGTTFSFSFLARAATELEPAGASPAPCDPVAATGEALRPGLRVLLVEDIATNRLVIRMLLARHAVVLTEAENGAEALEILAREDFDLVLLDMQMPVMAGPETISRIRAPGSSCRTVRVIALTASAMSGDREKFLQMGIDGYIPKPVEEDVLLSEIRAVT